MKVLRLSTQLHKWIALAVGIQVLFWVAGGLVMTAIPIETVRSEHHVREREAVPIAFDSLRSPGDIARARGLAVAGAELRSTPRGPATLHLQRIEAGVAADVEHALARNVREGMSEAGELVGGIVVEEVIRRGAHAAQVHVVEPVAQFGDTGADPVRAQFRHGRSHSVGEPASRRARPPGW